MHLNIGIFGCEGQDDHSYDIDREEEASNPPWTHTWKEELTFASSVHLI
jgi:hypothetical protein